MLPSLAEVELAIQQMRNGKGPGGDGLRAEIFKAGGRTLATWLHEITSDVWQNEEAIDDWSTAILIRLCTGCSIYFETIFVYLFFLSN